MVIDSLKVFDYLVPFCPAIWAKYSHPPTQTKKSPFLSNKLILHSKQTRRAEKPPHPRPHQPKYILPPSELVIRARQRRALLFLIISCFLLLLNPGGPAVGTSLLRSSLPPPPPPPLVFRLNDAQSRRCRTLFILQCLICNTTGVLTTFHTSI